MSHKEVHKRGYALVFVAFLGVFSILFGLSLIFSVDRDALAQLYSDGGAVYLIEASKLEAEETSDLFLKAYDAHLRAVELSPYNAELWVRLAYAAYALDHFSLKSENALEIAYGLDSSLDIDAHTQKIRTLSGGL